MKCAAMDLCILKTLPCTATHLCPVCNVNVHAMCGQVCEEVTIQFHTTCFKCVAKYGKSFKDPKAFHDAKKLWLSTGKHANKNATPGGSIGNKEDEEEDHTTIMDTSTVVHHGPAATAGVEIQGQAETINTSTHEIDTYKIGLKDSADVKIDKAKKRREFIKSLTLSHCTIEKDAGGGDLSQLVSIGAVPLSKLLLNDLMLFCSTHKISGYRQKKKEEVALLIAAKVASDNIYASIGRLGMTMETDGAAADRGKKRSVAAYRSKLVRPKAVTKTGSYFRAISLWFSAQNRHLALATGKKMNRAELDVGGYRHKSIWDNLADQYNKNTGVSTGDDAADAGKDNSYLDLIQVPHSLYGSENPEDFDHLDGQDLAQFIRWITNQYYVVHKSVSGDHARFEDRVGEKAYLLYFHNMVSASGAENMESLMKAELSNDVFAESSIDGSINRSDDADNTAATTGKKPRSRYFKGGPPPSSGAKERTDEAILKYLVNHDSTMMAVANDDSSNERRTAAAASTAAKDEYMREKKRIAVRADEVAMAREVSDAVDVSLQKWKASLKDLQSMMADGIPTDHPIYIATKATADLHESAFNSSLARATKVQQGEQLAAGLQFVATAADYQDTPSSKSTCSSFRSSNDDHNDVIDVNSND